MPRRGVTLLELLLALFLSVVVLAAVGMAINLYFKMLDVRRTSIEEIQVVRIVTQRMTNDIRMIVQPNEPDLSGLQTAFQNSMQAASKQATATASTGTTVIGAGGTGGTAGSTTGASTGGTGPPGNPVPATTQPSTQPKASTPSNPQTPLALYGGSSSGQSGGGAGKAGGTQGGSGGASGASGGGSAGAGGSTTPQAGASSATASSTTTPIVVKLVGSATELQFDISRIPRVDQYKGIVSGNGELSAVDLPSDVKTIAYYIRSDASADSLADDPQALGGEASTDGYGRGLMRAEIDRAVAAYAETGGGTASIYSSAQLLADEVVGLGFQYYDGTEALTEWDSSTKGLPRAIRVWLSVKPRYGMSEKEIAQANAGKEPQSTDFYFIITLPSTPLVVPPAAETADSSSSTSTSASASTSTGTGTTP